MSVEDLERIVNLFSRSFIIKNYHKSMFNTIIKILSTSVEIDSLFIKEACVLIHEDITSNCLRDFLFYQKIFPITYGYFKYDPKLAKSDIVERFTVIYDYFLTFNSKCSYGPDWLESTEYNTNATNTNASSNINSNTNASSNNVNSNTNTKISNNNVNTNANVTSNNKISNNVTDDIQMNVRNSIGLINDIFLQVKSFSNVYNGLYFIFNNFEKTVNELYGLYNLTFDSFYLECLFNIPISLNLLIAKYSSILQPMMAALRCGKRLREQVLRYVEYIVEFDSENGVMNEVILEIYKVYINSQGNCNTVDVLSRIGNKHKDYLEKSIINNSKKIIENVNTLIDYSLIGAVSGYKFFYDLDGFRIINKIEYKDNSTQLANRLLLHINNKELLPDILLSFILSDFDVSFIISNIINKIYNGDKAYGSNKVFDSSDKKAYGSNKVFDITDKKTYGSNDNINDTINNSNDNTNDDNNNSNYTINNSNDDSNNSKYDTVVDSKDDTVVDVIIDALVDGLIYNTNKTYDIILQILPNNPISIMLKIYDQLFNIIYSKDNLRSIRATLSLYHLLINNKYNIINEILPMLINSILFKLKTTDNLRFYYLSYDIFKYLIIRYNDIFIDSFILQFQSNINHHNQIAIILQLSLEFNLITSLTNSISSSTNLTNLTSTNLTSYNSTSTNLTSTNLNLTNSISLSDTFNKIPLVNKNILFEFIHKKSFINAIEASEFILKNMEKRDFNSLKRFIYYLRTIEDKNIFSQIVNITKKYIPDVSVLEGFSNINSRRAFVDSVNKNTSFTVQNPSSLKVFRNLFYNCKISTNIKATFIEIFKTAVGDQRNLILEILINASEYDILSFDFIFNNMDDSSYYARIYNNLKLQSNYDILLRYILDHLYLDQVFLFAMNYISLSSDVSIVLNKHLNDYITNPRNNILIYNILIYLKRNNYRFKDNKVVLLVYKNLINFENNFHMSELDRLINYYFQVFEKDDIELLFRINPCAVINSDYIFERFNLLSYETKNCLLESFQKFICFNKWPNIISCPIIDSVYYHNESINKLYDCESECSITQFELSSDNISGSVFNISGGFNVNSGFNVNNTNNTLTNTSNTNNANNSNTNNTSSNNINTNKIVESMILEYPSVLLEIFSELKIYNKTLLDFSIKNFKEDQFKNQTIKYLSNNIDHLTDNELANQLFTEIFKLSYHDSFIANMCLSNFKLNNLTIIKTVLRSEMRFRTSEYVLVPFLIRNKEYLKNNELFLELCILARRMFLRGHLDYPLLQSLLDCNIDVNLIDYLQDLNNIFIIKELENNIIFSNSWDIPFRKDFILKYLLDNRIDLIYDEKILKYYSIDDFLRFIDFDLALRVFNVPVEFIRSVMDSIVLENLKYYRMENIINIYNNSNSIEVLLILSEILLHHISISCCISGSNSCISSNSSNSSITNDTVNNVSNTVNGIVGNTNIYTTNNTNVYTIDNTVINSTNVYTIDNTVINDTKNCKDKEITVEIIIQKLVSLNHNILLDFSIKNIKFLYRNLYYILDYLDINDSISLINMIEDNFYKELNLFYIFKNKNMFTFEYRKNLLDLLYSKNLIIRSLFYDLFFSKELLNKNFDDILKIMFTFDYSGIEDQKIQYFQLIILYYINNNNSLNGISLNDRSNDIDLNDKGNNNNSLNDNSLNGISLNDRSNDISLNDRSNSNNNNSLNDRSNDRSNDIDNKSMNNNGNIDLNYKDNKSKNNNSLNYNKNNNDDNINMENVNMDNVGMCDVLYYCNDKDRIIQKLIIKSINPTIFINHLSYIHKWSPEIRKPFSYSNLSNNLLDNDIFYNPFNPSLKFYSLMDKNLYYGLLLSKLKIRESKIIIHSIINKEDDQNIINYIYDFIDKVEKRQASYDYETMVLIEEEIRRIFYSDILTDYYNKIRNNPTDKISLNKKIVKSKEFGSFYNEIDRFIDSFNINIESKEIINVENVSNILLHIPRNTILFNDLLMYSSINSEMIESAIIRESSSDSIYGRLRMWMCKYPSYYSDMWGVFMRWRNYIAHRALSLVPEHDKKKIQGEISKINFLFATKFFKEKQYSSCSYVLNENNSLSEVGLNMQKILLDLESLVLLGDYNSVINLINSLNIGRFTAEEKSRLYYYSYKASKSIIGNNVCPEKRSNEAEKFRLVSRKLCDIIENKKDDLELFRTIYSNSLVSSGNSNISGTNIDANLNGNNNDNINTNINTTNTINTNISNGNISNDNVGDTHLKNYADKLLEVVNELTLEDSKSYVLELINLIDNCGLENYLERIENHDKLYFFIQRIRNPGFLYLKNPLLESSRISLIKICDLIERNNSSFIDHSIKGSMIGEFSNIKNDYSSINSIEYLKIDRSLKLIYFRISDGRIQMGEYNNNQFDNANNTNAITNQLYTNTNLVYTNNNKNNIINTSINNTDLLLSKQIDCNEYIELMAMLLNSHSLKKLGFKIHSIPVLNYKNIKISVHQRINYNLFNIINGSMKRKNISPSFIFNEYKLSKSKLKIIDKYKNLLRDELILSSCNFNDFFYFKKNFINSFSSILPFLYYLGVEMPYCHTYLNMYEGLIYSNSVFVKSDRPFIKPNISSILGYEGLNGPLYCIFKEISGGIKAYNNVYDFYYRNGSVLESGFKKRVAEEFDSKINTLSKLIGEMVDIKAGSFTNDEIKDVYDIYNLL